MAGQHSLESVFSEFFKEGITIGLLGLGTEASLGQMFLTRFARDHMLDLPVKQVLVNNRDTSDRIRRVQNIIDNNLRRDVTTNVRDSGRQQQLHDIFDNGKIKAAESRVIADQADLIILSVDYGFKEPELAPASRYIVFNNNTKIMHQRVSGGKDGPRMFELLGDSRAHKLVLTNPVEYMCHFNMRELMKRRLLREDDFFYFLRDQVDKGDWEMRKDDHDLLGIPGKYLVAALKEFDSEYLSFLAKSWSGFVTSDISRQKEIVRNHVKRMFENNAKLKDRKFRIRFDDLYVGEHGAISEPVLSSIQVVPHDSGKRFSREFEFPFSEKGELHHLRDQISAAIKIFTPKQYNQHGNWINPSVGQDIVAAVAGITQFESMCTATYHEDDSEPPNPMMLTLLGQYFPYDCKSRHTTTKGPTIGVRIADDIAHQEGRYKGTLNKECIRVLETGEKVRILDTDEIGKGLPPPGNPPLGQIGINNIIKVIQKTIRSGEVNEMEVGIPHINAADTIVAVHDANNLEEILLTSFQGRDIPAGAIHIGRRVNKIASEGQYLVAYLNGRSGSKRLMRFKFQPTFIFKEKYEMYRGIKYKDGIEHSPDGEQFSLKGVITDQLQDFAIRNKKLYCLYQDKVEIRDVESLDPIPGLSIALDPMKNYSRIKVDAKGSIFLIDRSAKHIGIFDSQNNEKVPLEFADKQIKDLQFQGCFVEADNPDDSEAGAWTEKQYAFATTGESQDILCWDISDLDNIHSVGLKGNGKTQSGFAAGRYSNPASSPQDPAAKRLYMAKVVLGNRGCSYLEIRFYRLNKNNDAFEIDPELEDFMKRYRVPDGSGRFTVKSYGNYVLSTNGSDVIARHAHNREWGKDLDKQKYNRIINFEFLKLR